MGRNNEVCETLNEILRNSGMVDVLERERLLGVDEVFGIDISGVIFWC